MVRFLPTVVMVLLEEAYTDIIEPLIVRSWNLTVPAIERVLLDPVIIRFVEYVVNVFPEDHRKFPAQVIVHVVEPVNVPAFNVILPVVDQLTAVTQVTIPLYPVSIRKEERARDRSQVQLAVDVPLKVILSESAGAPVGDQFAPVEARLPEV
jgi:hypothetical protein